MKNVIGDAIAKIKSENIKPEPRWKYLIKKYGVWALFLTMVVHGAVSFSVAYDMMTQLDWDLYRFVHQSSIVYTFSMLPYLWLLLIGIFFTVAFADLRKTESGYKYSLLKISLLAAGSVIVLGTIFSVFGFGGKFNAKLTKDIPFYAQHMTMTKETQWMQSENGLLAGKIVSISANSLSLNDLNGKNWQIVLNEKTLIRPLAKIVQGEMIKIIGSKSGENNFQAIEVRPWMGMGMMGGQNQVQGGRMGNGSGNGMMK